MVEHICGHFTTFKMHMRKALCFVLQNVGKAYFWDMSLKPLFEFARVEIIGQTTNEYCVVWVHTACTGHCWERTQQDG